MVPRVLRIGTCLDSATVVYYTSNCEDPEFEYRIRRHLVATAQGLPIVSVSHQPIDFGQNICVGDVGVSNINIFRQMMIGAEAARSRYIFTAESDFIHPWQWFRFRPDIPSTMYVGTPLYLLFGQRGARKVYCLKERGSEGAMIAERELLLACLKRMLAGKPEWADTPGHGRDVIRMPYLSRLGRVEQYPLPQAIVSFRTGRQLHRKTPWLAGSEVRELPYWGTAESLIDRFVP